MNRLVTFDAESLYHEPQRRIKCYVEGLIPQGLNLICGAAKIGKSWLMLWLCSQIASGKPVWDRQTTRSDVLYLCLEDTKARIQERLFALTDEPPENLRLAVMCGKIGDELEEQIEAFLSEFPVTGFIVIDTLQKIRKEIYGNTNAYGNDYSELSKLKAIADRHNICILLVHHVRKLSDAGDPLNEVLGSTGITGTVDTVMVMKKERRFSGDAILYVSGRDVEQQELLLRFENQIWQLIESRNATALQQRDIPEFIQRLIPFMVQRREWSGTVSALLGEMGIADMKPNIASKHLNQFYYEALEPNGIQFSSRRTGQSRTISLALSDGSDANDGNLPREELPSQPSLTVTAGGEIKCPIL